MRGLQCAKSLYLTIHNKELEPSTSAAQQALFDQGHVVGVEAQRRFPSGVLIKAPYYDTAGAVAETEAAIKNGANTVFEATFSAVGLSAKIDILNRKSPKDTWSIIEVKSSTSVKPEYIPDVAIQASIFTASGYDYDTASVMYINNQTIAPDLTNLFTQTEVTKEIKKVQIELPKQIEEFRSMLDKPNPPSLEIGPHCDTPYPCPFKTHCWSHIESPSIFEIPSIGKKAWEYYEKGIVQVTDSKFKPSKSQVNRVEAIRSGKRWVDKDGIKEALSGWKYPLYFFDFETIAFAIPKYDGTRPFEQVPFQFSCLVQEKPASEPKEFFYLHKESTDPRPQLIQELIKAVKGNGNIVAYNMSFEARCIQALADFSPKHSKALLEAKERLVDPLPIFRSSVYDKNFKGSFSIKSVAPAILGENRSYKGMVIADGGETQRAFLELVDEKTPADRRKLLEEAMLVYCKKDTQEMVDLVGWLKAIL